MADIMKHNQFMQLAIDLAKQSFNRSGGLPFGAVVAIDGELAGQGMNESAALCDPTAHAEVMAIRNACSARRERRLPGGILYASCEPCPLCLAAAMWAGIADIHYACSTEDAETFGFSDNAFYRQMALPREKRVIRSQPMMLDEGREVMKMFEMRA